MALICMNVYCTEDNGKIKYLTECLAALWATTHLQGMNHRLVIVNQNSCATATRFVNDWATQHGNDISVINLIENIGTARGINLVMKQRLPGEYFIKTDEDITWETQDWVELMEETMRNRPYIGVLGLKREDVKGTFIKDGDLEFGDDVMGTCTMFSPQLMDAIGYSVQPSPYYGFEDNITNCRSLTAGFKNAYLTSVKITHLDEGNSEYTEWKKREAGFYLQEACMLMDKIKKGEIGYYYDAD